MLNPQTFHEIVSGRRRDLGARLLRGALRPVSLGYSLIVRARNRCYDSGIKATYRASVPIVSVGNLTLGGTGKTPMVAWLARWCQGRGVRLAVVSRGYGAKAGLPNDEAMELEQNLPGVPHLQNPDRVAAARKAVEQMRCELILLDDAFQHRRVGRDLDLVLLDACEPFGFDAVFPRGTLREPLGALGRADVVVLSRADMIEPARRQQVWARVRKIAPEAIHAEAAHVPVGLRSASGGSQPLDTLRGKPVAAFCAIGNPAGFRHTLEHSGVQPVEWRIFPDHHRYTPNDLQSLAAWAERIGATALVCTHKDLVKIGVDRLGSLPLWAVCVEFRFLAGQEALEQCLERILAPSGCTPPGHTPESR